MRLTRALIVTLALMVSPVAAAACEVVCGLPASGVADATSATNGTDEHAHHGHHTSPVVAAPDASSASLAAPDCDLTQTSPARLRTAFTDSTASMAAITSPTEPWGGANRIGQRPAATYLSPPAPPPHTPVPLRI